MGLLAGLNRGYYICDDCCKGFQFLWELAWVYDTIKRIDPYHLTAGKHPQFALSLGIFRNGFQLKQTLGTLWVFCRLCGVR